jgi:fumarate reductase subunit C
MHWTIKSNKGKKLLNESRKSYGFYALRFLSIYLTIENCIEFQLVVFKLCSGQEKGNGKVTKGNNSIITLDRVMVLVHCTSSYCA